MSKRFLTYQDISTRAREVASQLLLWNTRKLYGVPRGGVSAAYAVATWNNAFSLVDSPAQADVIIDDIVDSGRTRDSYQGVHDIPFIALYNKLTDESLAGVWLVFPWESPGDQADDTIVGTLTNRFGFIEGEGVAVPYKSADNVSSYIEGSEIDTLTTEVERRCEHLLRGLLIDTTNDPHTKDTARRMARMFIQETFRGRYESRPALTVFPNTSKLDELYVTPPITIRSTCAHHFCHITGRCWVGVVPSDSLLGLSKFNRLVDWFASRPQVQEELTHQIANEIESVLSPLGLAVVIKASHGCMTTRGVREHGDGEMATSVMRGVMRDKPEARAEFFRLISL